MFKSTIRDLNSGFSLDLRSAQDSRAHLKAAFICVDFPNKPAADSKHPDPSFFYELLAADGLRVFDAVSYGRLNLEVTLFDKWFTMPKNDDEYGMERVITYETHAAYIKDAIDVSSDEVDYDQFDILYIVPVHGSAVPYSPTMCNKDWPIRGKNGKGCGSVVTFGADMYFRKGKLFAHENGHILGLPDLYTYDVPEGCRDCFSHIGTFDLMGLIEGRAPDYLGYSKWRLGWIDDAQVRVLRAGESGVYDLTPVELSGGQKLIVMPIDEYNGYVLEYRTPVGLDTALEHSGFVLYRINGTVGNGRGCITVIPPEEEKYLALDTRSEDGLILPGVTVEREGIRLTALENGRVRIER